MKNYVITGLQSWDTKIGSNAKNIALELSKNNRVLYVNLPVKRKSMYKNDELAHKRNDILCGKRNSLYQINENLWCFDPVCITESINQFPAGFLFRFFNKINNKRFAKEIQKATKQLDFEKYILINDNCMFEALYLKELLKPLQYIYYFRDNLTIQPYFIKHGVACQNELFATSDWVAANSAYLRDLVLAQNQKAIDAGQGCELKNFEPNSFYPKPKELAHIKQPIIGYVGTLTHMRLDIPLLESLCKKTPQYTYVFVGPEDKEFENSTLHNLENVLFIGRKEVQELKYFLQYFDVCINPQAVNPLTIGNYPIKIDEYLSMGKPTVATETETMKLFENHVYLAKNEEMYLDMIQKALEDNSEQKNKERRAFALTHTWAASVEKILQGPA